MNSIRTGIGDCPYIPYQATYRYKLLRTEKPQVAVLQKSNHYLVSEKRFISDISFLHPIACPEYHSLSPSTRAPSSLSSVWS
jgi:hypothetical protein